MIRALLLLWAVGSCWSVAALRLNADDDRPLNVLFLAADDLRTDLGCYGHPLAKTPHLDQLARRGVVFERAYCQQALCNPSRASLLTGKRPDTLRIWDLPTHFREVDSNIVTLPEAFRRHGYYTQNIGKVFHNWRQKIQGDPPSWSEPAVLHFARHDDDKPNVKGTPPADKARAPRCHQLDVPDSAYFDGRIAHRAVAALQTLKKRNKPFFLAVGFWKPHLPFNPPKKYWDLYDAADIPLPVHSQPPRGVPNLALHDSREIMRAAEGNLTKAQVKELRRGYLAGISFLDAQVGKILDELDRLGLSENTVVVFWSDHGFHLGEHGLWCKTSNFENDARVPLIIAGPQTTAGGRSQGLVELLDIYPTLLDLCKIKGPADLEGQSLRSLLANPQTPGKSAAYTQHPRPAYYRDHPEYMGVSVRTKRYRYTEWRRFKTGEVTARELYDHRLDPHETINTIDRPADRAALREAQHLLAKQFPAGPYRVDE